MNRSPCAGCRHELRSKVKRPCRTCELPAEYADSLEPGPECRADPSYRMDYVTPTAIARQLGHTPIRLAERRRPQEVHIMRIEFNGWDTADVVCDICGRRVRLRSGVNNATEKETITTGSMFAIHTLASG